MIRYHTLFQCWHSSLDPQINWTSPWPDWKTIYVETLNRCFQSSKFNNVSTTFFVEQLGQKIIRYHTLFQCWHSSLDPQTNWISPWRDWKTIYVETLNRCFQSSKFNNVSTIFFVDQLSQKFIRFQTLIQCWHSSLDPQINWISPWLDWKTIYVETLNSCFQSSKFNNVSTTFFVEQLGQKIIRYHTLFQCWHSSWDPQIYWISPWLDWKTISVETLNRCFQSSKFNNVSTTFFVEQLGQKIIRYHTLFQCWHSSLDPQINWTSPWLDWKTIYVETLNRCFQSSKFNNVSTTFFVEQLGQKIIRYHTLFQCWHSSLDPQTNWISPWRDWKTIYVETLNRCFQSSKFNNVSTIFFVDQLSQKFIRFQTLIQCWHSSLDPQINWISPWLDWKTIYVETLNRCFQSSKFNNVSTTFLVE